MRDSVFLVYDSEGIKKTVKTTRGIEQGPGVYVQKVTLAVDDQAFERSIPDAEVEVPAGEAQPTEATVSYDDPDICTKTPIEVPTDELESHESLFRCPGCGAEKKRSEGEPFGVHYKPEDDEGGGS